jgi:hypothetical protein
MAQYRDYNWYIGRFEGAKNWNAGGVHRPPKTIDEAYVLVVTNLKRPGHKGEEICAKKAYRDFYKEDFMSPEQRAEKKRLEHLAELDRQIEEKKAQIAATVVAPEVAAPVAELEAAPIPETDKLPPLTKEQFKEKYSKDLGYGNPVGLTSGERLKCGKAWAKYKNKVE